MRLQFIVPEHNLHFDQLYGQTALQLFQGTTTVIASDSLNDGCASAIENTAEFDDSTMLLPMGGEFFGVNGFISHSPQQRDWIRFGMLAYDVNSTGPNKSATAMIGIGISLAAAGPNQNTDRSTAWGEYLVGIHDLCDTDCGSCIGNGSIYSKTSSNLWVR